MTPSSPFGDRRAGRLHRALVYFGLRDDPYAADGPPDPGEEEGEPRHPTQASEAPPTAWRRALVYFGLADGGGESRFGPGVTGRLDAELDELRRRVEALERDRPRRP